MDFKKIFIIFILVGHSLLAKDKPLISGRSPSAAEIRSALSQKLKLPGDQLYKAIRRIGDKTIEMQVMISMSGNIDKARSLFTDIEHIPDWALNNINLSTTGKPFYFKINNAISDGKDSLNFLFTLDLPIFKHKGSKKFKFVSKNIPYGFLVSAEATKEANSVISSAIADLYVFSAERDPRQLWLAVLAKVTFNQWLLYEALPERLVTRESASRLERLILNYQNEEDKNYEKEEKSIQRNK